MAVAEDRAPSLCSSSPPLPHYSPITFTNTRFRRPPSNSP